MKKKIFFLTLFAWQALASSYEADIKQVLKKHKVKESNIGVWVEESGNGLVNINADKLMIPASLTKIVTAGAILSSFPMNKKFTTELMSIGTVSNGKLKGDLCLKGGGDPSFVSEKMWYLVNEFKRTEIKEIVGDIVIDASRFDDELFDRGRESVCVDRAFDAPISATSFNWNSVNVFIRPGENVGAAAKIFIDPENSYIELENKTTTSKVGHAKSIEVNRVTVAGHDKIIVSGKTPEGSDEIVFYKSISNPKLWIGEHLKRFILERNIQFSGKIKEGECGKDAKILAQSPSKNLNEMISDMLKFSNNFVAEMLVKNLAAEKSEQKRAQMKTGIEEIKKYLDSLSIKRSEYELENVSGLTRENKFKAKQLATVLRSIKDDFMVFPEFLSGLPIAGVDGTLKNRLKNSSGDALVRAKTGYLDGVVGLSGFIARKNRPPLIFVFMYNGGYEDALLMRPVFDQMIMSLKK